MHHELHNVPAIKLKAIPFNNERVRWLTKRDRDRLIASYAPHVQPIITLLAFHGLRSQTALQLQWSVDGIDMERQAIRLHHTKNAVIQSVPMHPPVFALLRPIWEARGRRAKGHVFPNKSGRPYQDTSKARIPGGKSSQTGSRHRAQARRH